MGPVISNLDSTNNIRTHLRLPKGTPFWLGSPAIRSHFRLLCIRVCVRVRLTLSAPRLYRLKTLQLQHANCFFFDVSFVPLDSSFSRILFVFPCGGAVSRFPFSGEGRKLGFPPGHRCVLINDDPDGPSSERYTTWNGRESTVERRSFSSMLHSRLGTITV